MLTEYVVSCILYKPSCYQELPRSETSENFLFPWLFPATSTSHCALAAAPSAPACSWWFGQGSSEKPQPEGAAFKAHLALGSRTSITFTSEHL